MNIDTNSLLKKSLFGGYKKADTLTYIDEMQNTLETVKKDKDKQISSLKEEIAALKATVAELTFNNEELTANNASLTEQNNEISTQLYELLEIKETIVQLEISANVRAREIISNSKEEAAKLINSAKNDISDFEEDAKIKFESEMDKRKRLFNDFNDDLLLKTAELMSNQKKFEQLSDVITQTENEMRECIYKFQNIVSQGFIGTDDNVAIEAREVEVTNLKSIELPPIDEL